MQHSNIRQEHHDPCPTPLTHHHHHHLQRPPPPFCAPPCTIVLLHHLHCTPPPFCCTTSTTTHHLHNDHHCEFWVEVGRLACPDGQDGEAKTEYMEIKTSTCETRHQEPLKQNETKHCNIRDMFAISIAIDRRSTTWSARAKRNKIEIKIRLSPGGST